MLCVPKVLLMSTHNICFCGEIRKIFSFYLELWCPLSMILAINDLLFFLFTYFIYFFINLFILFTYLFSVLFFNIFIIVIYLFICFVLFFFANSLNIILPKLIKSINKLHVCL